jgi:hypothetical protein
MSYWVGETAIAVITRPSLISQWPSNPVSSLPAIIGPVTSRRVEKVPSVWSIVAGEMVMLASWKSSQQWVSGNGAVNLVSLPGCGGRVGPGSGDPWCCVRLLWWPCR